MKQILIVLPGRFPPALEAKMTGEFVKVASTSDIPEGRMKLVQMGNSQVCIAHTAGNYHAIGNLCTHVGGPLHQGVLKEFVVTCPWHGSQFDVRTGEVKHGPAMKPEPAYEVKVEGNNILLRAK